MKSALCILLPTFVVLVTGSHLFIGTNVNKEMVYHLEAKLPARPFKKRLNEVVFRVPPTEEFRGKMIQGIMAYDLTNGTTVAKLTVGGTGHTYMFLRLKSERGREMNYDVYVYV